MTPGPDSRAQQLRRLAPDLPLTITPGSGGPGDAFVVFLSGDGGWGGFDQQLARKLATAGLPVVGWDARSYFGGVRTPASSAADLQRVIETYGARFGRRRVMLVGYSFGANVLPFMTERLPDAVRERVAGLALISPTARAQFRFAAWDWVVPRRGGLDVAPAISRLDPDRTLCAYGRQDGRTICRNLPEGAARALPRPGGHHIRADAELVRAILDLGGEGSAARSSVGA